MKIIETTFEKLPTKCLLIGFEGENLRATVRIDCASVFAEYPNATPSLIVKPLFADAYPVVVERSGTYVDWLITSEILSFTGDGEIQLVFYKDQVICKSAVSKIRVSRSLQVTGEKPDPIARWEDAANQKLAEVDAVIVSIDEMDATAHGLPEGSAPTAEVQTVDDHKRISLGIPAGATGAKGDKGDKGDRGEVGATPQMGIGTVQTLPAGSEATASMSGTTENPLLNLGIPQGIQGVKGDRGEKGETGATGATGATPDLSIGTVSTLPAGASATAEITGTAENPVLSLGIPQGEQGIQGVQGEKGDPGDGVPAGGLKGQVLAKASDTDRDTEWIHVAPVIKNEASGAIASFADGADGHPVNELKVAIEPVQDLHGYDHPWPAGGGKNLLDPFIYDQVGDRYTANADGTITASISDGGDWNDRPAVPLKAGTYTVSYSATSGSLRYKTSEDNYTEEFATAVSKTFTLTADGGIKFKFGLGASAYPITVKAQLESGSTATDWTPFSNICPITGWTGAKVTRTGKNLLDGSNASSSTLYGVTFTPNSDGTITVNGTATQNINYFITNNDGIDLPNGSYVISGCPSGGGSTTYRLRTDNKTGQVRGNDTGNSATFTIDDGKLFATFITIWSGATCDNLVFHPQICLASAPNPTDYEPYAGNTYDITLPTEAGTVYGGELTVNADGSGSLVVDRAEVDLGTLQWRRNASDTYYFSTSLADVAKKPTADGILANIVFEQYASLPSVLGGLYVNRPDAISYNRNGNLYTVATETPSGQCVYELTTPLTFNLTASEIRTLLGQNNVWSDAGDVSVKYNADTKLYIDNKITQAISAALNS